MRWVLLLPRHLASRSLIGVPKAAATFCSIHLSDRKAPVSSTEPERRERLKNNRAIVTRWFTEFWAERNPRSLMNRAPRMSCFPISFTASDGSLLSVSRRSFCITAPCEPESDSSRLPHCLGQPLDALVGIAHGTAIFGEGNVLCGLLEGYAGQVPLVPPGQRSGCLATRRG